MLSAALSWPFSSHRTNMPPRKDTRRRASDTEEMLKQVLPGSAALAKDPEAEAEMKTVGGLSRMVDMRIPLVWLLAAVGSFAGFQIMLWSSVQKMTEAMVKVEAKLETSSAQTVQALIEVNRVKDRVDRVADDYRSLQQQVMQLQQSQQRPPR